MTHHDVSDRERETPPLDECEYCGWSRCRCSLPAGCKCDLHDWRGREIKPICAKFRREEMSDHCYCEHERDCHDEPEV